jgi:cell division protease FtsH
VKGREGILKVHARKLPLGDDVDLELLARGTPGFAGADLENVVNEAALLAARQNKDRVSMLDFEIAKDKVLMGSERKSMILSLEERRHTAYHEAGHALVAKLTPGVDPVHKVSIIPRGMALGVTTTLPADERHNVTRDWCLSRIQMCFGGRAAEELVFGHVTTGARDDIKKASEIAHSMVCEYGMSDKLGPVALGKKEDQVFLGRDFAQVQDYSERTAQEIDDEVRRIVTEGYEGAKALLKEQIDVLHAIAEQLLEKEALDGAQIDEIIRVHREQRDARTAPLSVASEQRA